MNKALLRYVAAVAVIMAAVLLFTFYYTSNLYTGPVNNPLPKVPRGAEWLSFLVMSGVFVGLKYLVYEMLVRWIRRDSKNAIATAVFYAGYALALSVDLYFIFISLMPASDAGFAFFGTFVYTPPVLLVATIIV